MLYYNTFQKNQKIHQPLINKQKIKMQIRINFKDKNQLDVIIHNLMNKNSRIQTREFYIEKLQL